MKIKEAVIKRCEHCNSYTKEISPDIYGCDTCKKEIAYPHNNRNTKYSEYLKVDVFYNNKEGSKQYQFCSWKCLFKKLKDIKTDYFISLPYLSFDKMPKGATVKDFFDCIKFE